MLPLGVPDPGGVTEADGRREADRLARDGQRTELVRLTVTAALETVWLTLPVLGL